MIDNRCFPNPSKNSYQYQNSAHIQQISLSTQILNLNTPILTQFKWGTATNQSNDYQAV